MSISTFHSKHFNQIHIKRKESGRSLRSWCVGDFAVLRDYRDQKRVESGFPGTGILRATQGSWAKTSSSRP